MLKLLVTFGAHLPRIYENILKYSPTQMYSVQDSVRCFMPGSAMNCLESAPSAGSQSHFFVVVRGIEYKMWKSLGLHVQVHFICAWQLARQIQINLHEHVHDPFHIVWVVLHSNQELLSHINSHTESFGTFGDFWGSGKMMNNLHKVFQLQSKWYKISMIDWRDQGRWHPNGYVR